MKPKKTGGEEEEDFWKTLFSLGFFIKRFALYGRNITRKGYKKYIGRQ